MIASPAVSTSTASCTPAGAGPVAGQYYDAHPEVYLTPRSHEERFVIVLERNNSNAKYRCPTCNHCFSGGNQKIRVHITGVREGGSSVKACPNPNPDALAYCSSVTRKPYKRRSPDDAHDSAQSKKLKVSDAVTESSCLEAWGLLHNSSKYNANACATLPEHEGEKKPISDQIFQDIVLRLFDEYGVEKPGDLALLDPEHLMKLSEVLKVVPRKMFLELMGVSSQPADM
jgi:hypothetical protein